MASTTPQRTSSPDDSVLGPGGSTSSEDAHSTTGHPTSRPAVRDHPRAPEHAEQVVLVDEDGTPVGTADKSAVHTTTTPLHLAFSVHVRDPRTGLVLMTRRALSKRTWPGVWTNAFCGHPAPGEGMEQAIARRAQQELGLAPGNHSAPVRVLPDFRYRAVDAGGIVENELCPVHVVDLLIDPAHLPAPRAEEVMDVAWTRWEDLRGTASTMPHLLSPWLVLQAEAPALGRALAP